MMTKMMRFAKKANEVMVFSGMNVVAYKRQMCYGSGEMFNLVFELDSDALMDKGLDFEDVEILSEMCPKILLENGTKEMCYWVGDEILYLSEINPIEVERWMRGLNDIKRYLRGLGF